MAGDRFKSPIVTAMARRQLFDGPTLTHVVSPIKAGQSILASPQKPVVQSPTSKYKIVYFLTKLYISSTLNKDLIFWHPKGIISSFWGETTFKLN